MKKLVIFLLAFLALKASYGQSAEVAPSYIKAPIVTVLPTFSLASDIGKIVYLQQTGDTFPFTVFGDLYLWDGIYWKALGKINQPLSLIRSSNTPLVTLYNTNSGSLSSSLEVINDGLDRSFAIDLLLLDYQHFMHQL